AALDLGGQTFDLVVSLFDSLNYILDPAALQSAFRRLYAHTAPGGLLAFDLNSTFPLSHDLFTQSQQSGPVQHFWKAHWNPDTRLCRVEMEFWVRDSQTGKMRHFTETHVQRAYTSAEITEWLAAAGYVRITDYGNYGELPSGPRSDRILFVAE